MEWSRDGVVSSVTSKLTSLFSLVCLFIPRSPLFCVTYLYNYSFFWQECISNGHLGSQLLGLAEGKVRLKAIEMAYAFKVADGHIRALERRSLV